MLWSVVAHRHEVAVARGEQIQQFGLQPSLSWYSSTSTNWNRRPYTSRISSCSRKEPQPERKVVEIHEPRDPFTLGVAAGDVVKGGGEFGEVGVLPGHEVGEGARC